MSPKTATDVSAPRKRRTRATGGKAYSRRREVSPEASESEHSSSDDDSDPDNDILDEDFYT